jgi:hypothetical protein
MQRVLKNTEQRTIRQQFVCRKCFRTVFVSACLTPGQYDRLLVECGCARENGYGPQMEVCYFEPEASAPN